MYVAYSDGLGGGGGGGPSEYEPEGSLPGGVGNALERLGE